MLPPLVTKEYITISPLFTGAFQTVVVIPDTVRNLFRIPLMILPFILAFVSCTNDMEVVKKFIDTESEPDLVSKNMVMLYTDSARLQTKMSAPVVKQYTSAKEQREECPEGIHVWFYEKTGELKAELTANWAKHDVAADIYEARGNVVITHSDGRKLETEQLFWEPKKGIVYSEKYTKITSPDGTVGTGDSFTTPQDFTKPKLINAKATIVLKDDDEE
jgi:LPS export ABC transporter protein LptC